MAPPKPVLLPVEVYPALYPEPAACQVLPTKKAGTYLVNLLIGPVLAHQRLDISPNQKRGKDPENQEPGEEEAKANATAREKEARYRERPAGHPSMQ